MSEHQARSQSEDSQPETTGDPHHRNALQDENALRHSDKISNEFAERLAALPAGCQVRAVVLPAPYLVSDGSGTRTRGDERQAILREARTRTEETFGEIDKVLTAVGGKRLTEAGNAFGYILIETCRAGIAAIANLGWVGAVMEDQAIRPVHQTES